ncbi:class I SAM-dependent DNA methyltransferase [Jatrophihabitans sp.]|uniref:class I SAM-dependent DNA methyltransferase n=1 Tax=Jatrophihabitans sp. TaxID=1932789 RepID=UPI002CB8AD0D|nr:class I SAM-dependent methyltransferase [Jatrophihabitans sp.]
MQVSADATTGPQSLVAPNYLHDAPELYEAYTADVGTELIEAVAARLARRGAGSVLDVGCGPGAEMAFLRARGFHADGVDASGRMVARARERCPDARVEQRLMTDLDLPDRYDCILCLGSTFLYNYTPAEVDRALTEFRRHLQPSGLLVLEMRNGGYFLTEAGQRLLHDTSTVSIDLPDGSALTCTSRLSIDVARQRLRREYAWSRGQEESATEVIFHRLLFPVEIRYLLQVAGFEVLSVSNHPASLADEAWSLPEQLDGPRVIVAAHMTREA